MADRKDETVVDATIDGCLTFMALILLVVLFGLLVGRIGELAVALFRSLFSLF